MKKILFLGGDNFQTNIILKAKKMGYFTICLDNKRENPGHKIANKSIKDVKPQKKIFPWFCDKDLSSLDSIN